MSLEGTFLHKIQVVQAELTTHFHYPTSKAQMALLASLPGAVGHTKDPLEYIVVLQKQGIDSQATHPLGPKRFLLAKVSMPKIMSSYIKAKKKISL